MVNKERRGHFSVAANSNTGQIMVLDCMTSHYITLDQTLLILSDNVLGGKNNENTKNVKCRAAEAEVQVYLLVLLL